MAFVALMLHPASLLLIWAGFALSLQGLSLWLVLWLTLLSLGVMSVISPRRGWRLIHRARWLMLSLLVLFVFVSPGEYLPGVPGDMGITYEGIRSAGEQLGRLLTMLATLALLHQQIGNDGIMAGLYGLIGPCTWRETTVVRLMLVLECVEQKDSARWRDWLTVADQGLVTTECLQLQVATLQWRDRIVMLIVLLVSAWSVFLS